MWTEQVPSAAAMSKTTATRPYGSSRGEVASSTPAAGRPGSGRPAAAPDAALTGFPPRAHR
jgi:hypothetical protein